MKKMKTLFRRDFKAQSKALPEVEPECEWVLAGEGVATRKLDGTCAKVGGGRLYRRYDAKAGKQPPPEFEPADVPDPVTGHWPGWLPIGAGSEDQYFREAWTSACELGQPGDGTYELCGPKVQGNPEGYASHVLVRHGSILEPDCPRSFEELKAWLYERSIEGVVWHHPDGRMVKLKRSDFHKSRR